MQIDLANILVHKVYSIHNDISPQVLFSPPLGGVGGGLFFNGEGTLTSELIIR